MECMSEHTGLISYYQLLITAACTNTSGKMKDSHSRAAGGCPFVPRHSWVRLPLSCSWECYVFVKSVCSPCSVHEPLAHSSPHPTQSTNTYFASSSTNGRSYSASSRPPASASNLQVAVLNANSVKGKRAELAALCDTTNLDIIIIIAETKIDSAVSTSEFLPKSHTAFRKDRTYHGGGVLVAVRNTFTAEEVCIECEGTEFICVKVTRGI